MRDPAPYQQIKDDLLARIHAGQWRPGDTIPGEQQLAADFGCARTTVHRALRELADEGLLERRRKTGTRVAIRKSRNMALAIPLVEDEIRATGASYHYRLLSCAVEPLPAAEAPGLDRLPGDEALHLRCLHFADRAPYQLEDRWIDLQTVPAAADADFSTTGPNPWLLSHVPWSDAEHTIQADLAAGSTAEMLGLPEGDPVLIVSRRTWNADGPVTHVRFTYPGRTHRLKTSFDTGG